MFADGIMGPAGRKSTDSWKQALESAPLRRRSKTSDICFHLGEQVDKGARIHTDNSGLMIILTLCLISAENVIYTRDAMAGSRLL